MANSTACASEDDGTREVISALYGMEIEVYSLRGDTLRVCIPGEKEAFR